MKRMHMTVELKDGTVLRADSTSADYLRYEQVAKRHKWGSMTDNPAVWEIFIGWAAVVRTGQYSGTWEQFANVNDPDAVNVDGELFDADPIPLGHGGDG
jgi:hypothetical protein